MGKVECFTWSIMALVGISTLIWIGASLHTIASPPTHNDAGGYIDACGELPGMVGDDC